MKTFICKLFIKTKSQEFTVGLYRLDAKSIEDASKQVSRFNLPFHHYSTIEIEK